MASVYLLGYLAIIFIAVFAVALLTLRVGAAALASHAFGRFADGARAPARARRLATLVRMSAPLARLSMPDPAAQGAALPLRFLHAGLRNVHAPILYYGAKTTLALALPLAAASLLLGTLPTLGTGALAAAGLGAAAFGFYLPTLYLARRTRAYRRAIFEHFPDALDLLTVCLEAGLALDGALARVAQELAQGAPAVSGELQMVTLELRAGAARDKALRNFAARTGVEGVDALVAMLIQAERFGTSTVDALRSHAEELRIKRRQGAEENAAKVALKLLFPLIFCIFPALLLVLLGPAMIQIYRAMSPAFAAP